MDAASNMADRTEVFFFTGRANEQGSNYVMEEFRKCQPTGQTTDFSKFVQAVDLRPEWQAQLCDVKCVTGCSGPECMCDGYDAANGAGAPVLCLDAARCQEACESHPQCNGYEVHRTVSQCLLTLVDACDRSRTEFTKVVHQNWNDFRRSPGTACVDVADFSKDIGDLYITKRFHTGVDFVLYPGNTGSLEVTASQCSTHGASLAEKFDTVNPVFDTAGYWPLVCASCAAGAAATMANDESVVVVAFDEAIVVGDTTKKVQFIRSSDSAALNDRQDFAIVNDRYMFIYHKEGGAAADRFDLDGVQQRYYVKLEAGAVRDMNGNPNAALDAPASGSSFEFTVRTTDTDAPVLKQFTHSTTELALHFTERVQSVTNGPRWQVFDCGADAYCSAADMAVAADVLGTNDEFYNGAQAQETGKVLIPVRHDAPLVATNKYVLKVPAHSVQDMAGNTGPATALEYSFLPVEGTSLEPTTRGASRDRILIIPCSGTCGKTSPSNDLAECGPSAADCSLMSTWNTLFPVNWMYDLPDEQTTLSGLPLTPTEARKYEYSKTENAYCSHSQNIVIATHADSAVQQHQCYSKCVANAPCVGSDCFCGGAYIGHDGPSSNALCLDQDSCQALCNVLGDACESIDVHNSRPRCFLKMPGCDNSISSANGLTIDASYSHLHKQADFQVLERQSRLVHVPEDNGYSSEEMLRFTNIRFNGAGKFKVCACDSELQSQASGLANTQHDCNDAADFNVEVGTIHVSGVSCLLTDAKFRRGDCVKQYHGGLRCYGKGKAVSVTPKEIREAPRLAVPADAHPVGTYTPTYSR
mmetsp:Transcript_44695/g.101088  ORF Transcript_44695/g.101088 Transcript_44695/m.101088 type:complete len:812 (+) Transcript_44695:99-2534(+)